MKFKELNERRTQGVWLLNRPDYEVINIITENDFICEIPHPIEINEDTDERRTEALANAEYIALCVNNFASLVETIQTIKDNYETNLGFGNTVSLQEIKVGLNIINKELNKLK